MDTIFRIFMFILPYGFSIAAYIWIGKKAWKTPNKVSKIIAFTILAAGLGYTLYRMITTSSKAFADDRFEFIILIVNVFVLFFAAIAITLGEPEEKIVDTVRKD
ncbi:MAG TPA: hypothetical protein VEY10_11460 [Flavisolibacter sp.]|nr:hypothetical protein [Flavisolibacter sp.]